jgi:hypothetical protein
LEKYPEVFKPETLKLHVFLRFCALLGSRSFGSNIPHSSMIPMADNFNHGNKDCGWGMVNTELHMQADEKSSYFIPARFLKNHDQMF